MKNKILQAEGKELSRVLGEVFPPKMCFKCVHREVDWETVSCGNSKSDRYNTEVLSDFEACSEAAADPIPLTWPEAMKWRVWAVGKYNCMAYLAMLKKIYTVDIVGKTCPFGWSFDMWLMHARPKHYLKAAALCAEKGE